MSRDALEAEYYFAYIGQLTSFAILAISNIVLPNFLGGADLYRFNQAMAISLITFSLTGDGVLFVAVNHSTRRRHHSRAAFFLRLTFEHVLLTALLTVPMFLAVQPRRDRTLVTFLVVLATTIVVTLYNSIIFYCAATFRNRLVAVMALWNGLLYFSVPIAFHAQGGPVYLAPLCCFALSLVPAIAFVRSALVQQMSEFRSTLAEIAAFPRLIRISEVMFLSAGKAFKMLALWGPILYLGGRANTLAANNYRITVSLMEGVGALVPYPKNAMLSLLRDETFRLSTTAARAVRFSVFVAAGGALCLLTFGGLVVRYVFIAQYAGVESMLRVGFLYLPLMVVTMVLGNSLTAENKIVPMSVGYVGAALVGIATLVASGEVIGALLAGFTTLTALLWVVSSSATRRVFADVAPVAAAFAIACVLIINLKSLAVQIAILIFFAGSFFFTDPFGRELRIRYGSTGKLLQNRLRDRSGSPEERDRSTSQKGESNDQSN